MFDDLKTIFNSNNNNINNNNESDSNNKNVNENENENENDDDEYEIKQINNCFKMINETQSFEEQINLLRKIDLSEY